MPSGASTGAHEAVELRDGDTALRRQGRPQGRRATSTTTIGRRSSASTRPTRRRSTRSCRAGRHAEQGAPRAPTPSSASRSPAPTPRPRRYDLPLYRYLGGVGARILPVPMINILNGGKHAGTTDFQEFMVMPVGVASFSEALRAGAEIYAALRTSCTTSGHATGRRRGRLRAVAADERGRRRVILGPSRPPATGPARTSRSRSTRRRPSSSKRPAARDGAPTATSSPARAGRSTRRDDRPVGRLGRALPDRLASRTGWPRTTGTAGHALTERLGETVQLIGDDLFVTNTERLERGIERGRRERGPDQAQPDRHAHRDARRDRWRGGAGWAAVISHRSGETEDTTIADLAVATAAGQIKTGAPSRSERVAKYNRLLRIEDELGDGATSTSGRRR